MIAGKTPQQVFEQRDGFAGLAFAAIKSAEQDLGVDLIYFAFPAHLLERLQTAFLVPMEADQKAQHTPRPRQTAHNIVVHALNQARIIIGGIDLGDAIGVLTSGGGITQRITPGFPHQKRIIRSPTECHTAGIERARVVGVPGQAGIGEIDGFLDFIGELLFHLGARVQLFLTQERIISRDQLGLERAIAVHFTIEQGLGDVVVGAHGTGILTRGFFELREGLIVFEIVEVIEAAPGWHVLGRQGDSEQSDQRQDGGTPGKLHSWPRGVSASERCKHGSISILTVPAPSARVPPQPAPATGPSFRAVHEIARCAGCPWRWQRCAESRNSGRASPG